MLSIRWLACNQDRLSRVMMKFINVLGTKGLYFKFYCAKLGYPESADCNRSTPPFSRTLEFRFASASRQLVKSRITWYLVILSVGGSKLETPGEKETKTLGWTHICTVINLFHFPMVFHCPPLRYRVIIQILFHHRPAGSVSAFFAASLR